MNFLPLSSGTQSSGTRKSAHPSCWHSPKDHGISTATSTAGRNAELLLPPRCLTLFYIPTSNSEHRFRVLWLAVRHRLHPIGFHDADLNSTACQGCRALLMIGFAAIGFSFGP